MRLVRRLVAAAVALAVVTAAVLLARPYIHGLSLVIRAADLHGTIRRLADLDRTSESEHDLAIPTSTRMIRARLYQPAKSGSRVVLLVSGLHPGGIDEPRLVRLSRELSADNMAVVTPEIPELSHFEITPAITDTITEAASWLATDSGLAVDHKVGLAGISFSGGLSIVAAGRAALADHVAFVFSFGGHDDLPRVLRYLCTGSEPYPPNQIRLLPDAGANGENGPSSPDQPFVRPPHDYGVAIILLGVADRVVPRAQVAPLKLAIRRFLTASTLDAIDKQAADREFAAVRALAKTMPEPSATLVRYVSDRDVVHLGLRLLPYVGLYGGDPALSVSKSPKPLAPAFLLHGTDDNVIPPIESEYLASDLRGHAPVRLLLSDLISHVDVNQQVRPGALLELAGFWGDLLQR
jgi:dienelactone hydrolase